MKKYLIIIALLFTQLAIQAQRCRLLNDSLSTFGIEAAGGIGSKSITWAFARAFVEGGNLSREIRQKVLDNISASDNYSGAMGSAQIFYKQKLAKGFLFFGIEGNQYIDARFSKDLFQLSFFGNKSFEGKTALLHPFYLMETRYVDYKIGWGSHWKGIQWGVNLGLLQGLSINRVETKRGDLFTAVNGEFIDVTLQLQHEQAEAASNWKGKGFAADLFLKFALGAKTTIGLSVNQLGVMKWSDDSKLRLVDSSYHFEGIEVGGLLDSVFVNVKSFEDLKDDWIETTTNKSFQTTVPFRLGVQLEHSLTDRFSIGLHGLIIPLESFKPRVGVELDYKLFNWTLLGISANYGGFSEFDVGLVYEQKLPFNIITSARASMAFDQLQSKGAGAYVGVGVYKSFGK